MRAVIHPGRAKGVVAAPPSKSMAHRLLICAGLARGKSVVRQVDPSEDILATADCLEALGASLQWEGSDVRIEGCDPARSGPAALFCRESGSTLRFMIPLCLLSGAPIRLEGSETLMSRPLSVYEDLCLSQGLSLERKGRALTVRGPLSPGKLELPASVSSQFISGLLFALPLLDKSSVLHLIPPVESRPYVDMTVDALNAFGVSVRWADEQTLLAPGKSAFGARDVTVEGDWSNAAFFEALNQVGGEVRVIGLKKDSLQGDRVCGDYFARLAAGQSDLDVRDCPDLAPVLFAMAAACGGARFTGTRRLKFKESDRGEAMARELEKFGVSTDIGENEIVIRSEGLHPPRALLSSHNDHRIAMALSVLCTVTGGEIDGAEAVRKSLPDYWDRLQSLGIEVELHGMDQ